MPGRRPRARAAATRAAETAVDSPGLPSKQLVGIGTGQGHDEIEPVEQRGREATGVAGPVGHGAAAGAVEDALAARARVHGRHQEELGREGDGARRPG